MNRTCTTEACKSIVYGFDLCRRCFELRKRFCIENQMCFVCNQYMPKIMDEYPDRFLHRNCRRGYLRNRPLLWREPEKASLSSGQLDFG